MRQEYSVAIISNENVSGNITARHRIINPVLTISKSVFFIYGFRLILGVNGDYFLKQR
jgi:hypothetical protein